MKYVAADGRVFLNRSSELYDLILLDAYRGGMVPFHLLTKEFHALIKQHLAPGGAAAFNVHTGTRLYASTVKTLSSVFPGIDVHPSSGEAIVVATPTPLPDKDTLARKAAALQDRYGFRFPLPYIFARRTENPLAQVARGDLLTDDFAPAYVFEVTEERKRTKN
jgi:spermidine synthase